MGVLGRIHQSSHSCTSAISSNVNDCGSDRAGLMAGHGVSESDCSQEGWPNKFKYVSHLQANVKTDDYIKKIK